MYSVKPVTLLENVLTPKKLLFLVDATRRATSDDIATCLGTLLCSYPSASPNYMREVAIVWQKYRPASLKTDYDTPENAEVDVRRTALTHGQLRMFYAKRVFDAMPFALAPPAPIEHAKSLVRIIGKVASITSYSRTGDMMVHKNVMCMVPPEKAAGLSIRDTPYHLAGEHFGKEANRVVRAIFEQNVDEVFRTTNWETAVSVKEFIFFVSILFETGEDIHSELVCNHEVALQKYRNGISLFTWQDKFGCITNNRTLYADTKYIYPIPSLILAFLELLAASTLEGSKAAEVLLCAIKTPEKAWVSFIFSPVFWGFLPLILTHIFS